MSHQNHKLSSLLFEEELITSKKNKNVKYSQFQIDVTEAFIVELRSEGLLTEGVIVEARELLEEGFWDAVQRGVGNFLGGIDKFLKKIGLKKEPKDYERAQEIFQKVLERESNKKVKQFIDALKEEIKDKELAENPDLGVTDTTFPYNRTADVFNAGVDSIAIFYDSLVAATKESDPDKKISVPQANELIGALVTVVDKFIRDVEREKGGMYASFGGGGKKMGDAKVGGAGAANESYSKLVSMLFEADRPDISDETFEKVMADPKTRDVFNRLNSMKAPALLAALGITSIGLGWLAQSDFLMSFFKQNLYKIASQDTTAVKEFTSQTTDYVSANFDLQKAGYIGSLAKASGVPVPADYGTSAFSQADALQFFSNPKVQAAGKALDNASGAIYGNAGTGTPFEMLQAAAKGPGANYYDAMKNAGIYSKSGPGFLSDYKGPLAAKPGKLAAALATSIVTRTVMQTTSHIEKLVPAGTGITATGVKIAALAPLLGGLGVGLVGAGATLAYVRKRAKSKSRLAILQGLKEQLEQLPIPPADVDPPAGPVKVTITLTDGPGGEIRVAPTLDEKEDETKNESFYRGKLASLLFEDTDVVVSGKLKVDGVEGDNHSFKVPSLDSSKFPPKIDKWEDLPASALKQITGEIEKVMQGFKIDDPNVTVDLKDMRKKGKPDDTGTTPPPPPPTPPKPVDIDDVGKAEVRITLYDKGRVDVLLVPMFDDEKLNINGKEKSKYEFSIRGELEDLPTSGRGGVPPKVTDHRKLPSNFRDRLEDSIKDYLKNFSFNDRSHKVVIIDERPEGKKAKGAGSSAPKIKINQDVLQQILQSIQDLKGSGQSGSADKMRDKLVQVILQVSNASPGAEQKVADIIDRAVDANPKASAEDVASDVLAPREGQANESFARRKPVLAESSENNSLLILRWQKLAGVE